MNTISASVPADRLHGDEGYKEYSPAEAALIERRTGELTTELLTDPAWWNDRLEEANTTIAVDLPGQIARCMGNIDNARRGEPIAFDAITTVLSALQRAARPRAMEQAREQAEQEMAAGELA